MNLERANVHRGFGGQAKPGAIASYVLLPGSKARVQRIAARMKDAQKIADHYEFLIYTGEYGGARMSVCSTGIGGTPVSIAVEELALLGGRTFLRVGVTSPLADELTFGELVIARGSVRWDGASLDYVRSEFPALAHFEVVLAAISAAEMLGQPYKVGIIGDMASLGARRKDGFRHYLEDNDAPKRKQLLDAGVIDGSGESAMLFVMASIYGFRAGAVHINGLDEQSLTWNDLVEKPLVDIGLETMRILAEWDRRKEERGLAHTVPVIPD